MNTNRSIRVFVSSTFRDMQAERDYLVKFTFPQLRKLCESRGVTWGEVDLRWGITDEERAEGKVLPLCLAEIHRCRPYFIGLLGERYGWIPDGIPPEVLERESWLREHLNEPKSVTELEILHGVLNNPEMANHAFFYFRDPNYIEQLATEQRSDFASEDPESVKRLEDLKGRIRHNHFPIRENYADQKALGELVLKDFTELIDLLFPEGEQLDPLERDALDHEAFAQSRARVYIGRQEYFDRLDEHVMGDSPPLVVLGESGSGKSALLANWSAKYREDNPSAFVIQHYIGATPYSADWAAMLRRIMGELKRRFDLQQGIPDRPDALCAEFATWLHMAAAKGKVVLILDALNQLDDHDGAPDLVWLPPLVPANIRIVLSTLPGRALEDLSKREWPRLEVRSLEPGERRQLIANYLANYTKSLSAERTDRIVRAPQTANPLYLRSLLEEIRLYGDHFTLNQRIDFYLAAATVDGLYEKILERYEQDYEYDRPQLVQDVMAAVWASRRGLSEAEILELVESNGHQLPRAYWSALYVAAEASLLARSGLIGFAHDYLREAVRRRYLPTPEKQKAEHRRLARYFGKQQSEARSIDELPWQLSRAESWQDLFTLLTDPLFFARAWLSSRFNVRTYWALIEANSALRLENAYSKTLETLKGVTENSKLVSMISALLYETGHYGSVMDIQTYSVEHYRRTGNRKALADALGDRANVLHLTGQPREAIKLYQEQELISRESKDLRGLDAALNGQAVCLHLLGELEQALQIHKEQEAACRASHQRESLLHALANQGHIRGQQGNLDAAMDYTRR